MKKFNFIETYLNESFFDDIDNDIQNQYEDDFYKKAEDLIINKEKVLSELNPLFEICYKKTIYSDLKVDLSLDFNVLTITFENASIEIYHIDRFLKFLDLCYKNYIKEIILNLISHDENLLPFNIDNREVAGFKELDGHNIKIIMKNKGTLLFNHISIKNMYLNVYSLMINHGTIGENIKVNVNWIDLTGYINIDDFSFIENIEEYFLYINFIISI